MNDDATEDGIGPAWLTVAATGVGYGALLLVMFALLFLVPYGLFVVLG